MGVLYWIGPSQKQNQFFQATVHEATAAPWRSQVQFKFCYLCPVVAATGAPLSQFRPPTPLGRVVGLMAVCLGTASCTTSVSHSRTVIFGLYDQRPCSQFIEVLVEQEELRDDKHTLDKTPATATVSTLSAACMGLETRNECWRQLARHAAKILKNKHVLPRIICLWIKILWKPRLRLLKFRRDPCVPHKHTLHSSMSFNGLLKIHLLRISVHGCLLGLGSSTRLRCRSPQLYSKVSTCFT